MKTLKIFEPAMCCDTGLCGPSLDPELFRISTVISILKKHNIMIGRYNLSNAPQEFVTNPVVNQFVMQSGVDELPLSLLNGQIVKTKTYPTNQEICLWLELPEHTLDGVLRLKPKCCNK
jgi:hypothetical protein